MTQKATKEFSKIRAYLRSRVLKNLNFIAIRNYLYRTNCITVSTETLIYMTIEVFENLTEEWLEELK